MPSSERELADAVCEKIAPLEGWFRKDNPYARRNFPGGYCLGEGGGEKQYVYFRDPDELLYGSYDRQFASVWHLFRTEYFEGFSPPREKPWEALALDLAARGLL